MKHDPTIRVYAKPEDVSRADLLLRLAGQGGTLEVTTVGNGTKFLDRYLLPRNMSDGRRLGGRP